MLKNFILWSVALACFFIGCGTDTSAVFLEPGENLEGGGDGSGGESSSVASSSGGSGGQGGVQEVVPCSGECQH